MSKIKQELVFIGPSEALKAALLTPIVLLMYNMELNVSVTVRLQSANRNPPVI